MRPLPDQYFNVGLEEEEGDGCFTLVERESRKATVAPAAAAQRSLRFSVDDIVQLFVARWYRRGQATRGRTLVEISGRICVSWRKEDYVHFVERKSVWNGKCKRHPQHPVVLPTIPLYPHLTPHHLVQLQENAAQAPRGARNEGQQGTTTLRSRRGRRVLAS